MIIKIISSDKDSFLKERFWIAISTHRGEEDFCLKTHLILKENTKELNFNSSSPYRKVERNWEIVSKTQNEFSSTGKNDDILENKEIIIINFLEVCLDF